MKLAQLTVLTLAFALGVATGASDEGAEWAYHDGDGYLGPDMWADDEAYAECGGDSQSPIDIAYDVNNTQLAPLEPGLMYAGNCSNTTFGEHGTDYKWTVVEGDCTATVNGSGEPYTLSQYHVHAPSEHSINGKLYDAEFHFVHESEDGSALRVIGVLVSATAEEDNPWVTEAFAELENGGEEVTVSNPYDNFIPMDGLFFNYDGSLTTPPCSEIVDWWVASTVVEISPAQLEALVAKQKELPRNDDGANNRPVQPLNDREVRPLSGEDGEAGMEGSGSGESEGEGSGSGGSEEAPWAYHNESGFLPPDQWSEGYETCGGTQQSPIDVTYEGDLEDVGTIMPSVTAEDACNDLIFTGHHDHGDFKWSLANENASCVAMAFESDTKYYLSQFHVHAPSEHTINGKSYGAEVHFVHFTEDGESILVLGVLLDTTEDSEPNAWIEELWAPIRAGDEDANITVSSTYNNFVPLDGKWFNYDGSLTTPPCSEIVDWWLAAEPVLISQEQLDALVAGQKQLEPTNNGTNNRPIQDTNDRDVRPLNEIVGE